MYAAVVELDTLSDTVRAAAENHDLLVFAAGALILNVVAGVVVCRILCSAYMNALPAFLDSGLCPGVSDLLFGNLQKLA